MVSVGIDIGNYSIKVVEIEATNRGYKVNRFLKIPLSIDPNKDKEIEILDALRNLAQEYDPANTKFVLGVALNLLTVRPLSFPFKERHKILKSIPFELEDDIPIPQEETLFTAKVIEYIGIQTEVLALACPKKVVENRIKLSNDCNFPLDVLSVNSFALANLFTSWQEAPPQSEAKEDFDMVEPAEVLLDFGHKVTHLLVLRKGMIVEVRDFDWGGFDLANSLATHKSLHISEAIRELEKQDLLLVSHETATQEQIKTSDNLKQEIDKFTRQLKLTLLELKSQYHLNYVKGTILGGVSQLKNFNAFLTQKTDVPYRRADILSLIPEESQHISSTEGSLASIAIGLAIEGIKKPKNPAINLRLGEYKKESQTFQLYINKWSHTLSVLIAAFIFLLIYGMLRENFTLQMADKAEDALRAQGEQILGEKRIRVSLQKVNQYIKKQKQIQKNIKMTENLQHIKSALDVLTLVSQKVPPRNVVNINVKNFKLENENLRLEGEVKSPASLNQLQKALENIALAKKVEKATSTLKAQPGWMPFAYEMKIQRREGS